MGAPGRLVECRGGCAAVGILGRRRVVGGCRLASPSAAGQGRYLGYPPLRDGGGAHPLTHARVSASLLGGSCLVARASWSVPSPAPDALCWAPSRGRSSPPWLHRDCLPRLSCLRGCCERPSRPGVSPPCCCCCWPNVSSLLLPPGHLHTLHTPLLPVAPFAVFFLCIFVVPQSACGLCR